MTESRNYRLVHGGGGRDEEVPHILVVGGGYLGMYTARRLEKKLGAGEARITVIDPNAYMTYQPFLPETAAGSISPRHVVVPLRRAFKRARVLGGRVVRIDHADRLVRYETDAGMTETLGYDYLVMASGAVSRTLPIPGLAEWGIGIKTVEEATHLRNHVLNQLAVADSTNDRGIRRKALNFVFVGAGFAGAEAVAELEDMVRDAVRLHPTIDQDEVQFYLVEAADRILPEVGPDVGQRALNQMRRRGIDVRLNTFLESAADQRIRLSDGAEFDAATLVWTAGVKPSPVVAASDLPLGPKGHLDTSEYLTVNGVENAFAGGDNAQVPDGRGGFYPPNAQNAVRMAPALADNVIATLRGRKLTAYEHTNLGAVAGLGVHKGAAQLLGKVKLTGRLAWYAHRGYHLMAVPTFNRKLRVLSDWTLGALLNREVATLPEMAEPRQAFEEAARPQVEDGRLRRAV